MGLALLLPMPSMMRSGTTPTIVSHGSFDPGRLRFICRPIGSTFGKCVRANDWLIIATGRLAAVWLLLYGAGIKQISLDELQSFALLHPLELSLRDPRHHHPPSLIEEVSRNHVTRRPGIRW